MSLFFDIKSYGVKEEEGGGVVFYSSFIYIKQRFFYFNL